MAFVPTSGPNRFETLLDWDDLNHLIESGYYPIETLSVFHGSFSVPTNLDLNQGRVEATAFSSLMHQGASLIFNRLHEYLPKLLENMQPDE